MKRLAALKRLLARIDLLGHCSKARSAREYAFVTTATTRHVAIQSICSWDHKDRVNKGRGGIGQRNGNAKLSDAMVEQIRKEYQGQRGEVYRLAGKYGVSADQIRNVLRVDQRMNRTKNIWWIPYNPCKITDDQVKEMRNEWDGIDVEQRPGNAEGPRQEIRHQHRPSKEYRLSQTTDKRQTNNLEGGFF